MDINSAKKSIYAAIDAGDAMLMEGKHGIGKSQIVRQFAKENDYHLEELFLSNQEVGDLIGIPEVQNNTTLWTVPSWLRRMQEASVNGKQCILHLDEFNRAEIDVRQAALQLVLEGKIHEHTLPVLNNQKTMIVASINPPGDYQVHELDPALLDRFLYVNVEVDTPAWIKYAKSKNINNTVVSFIMENPTKLHYTPNEGIGSSPRAWEKLAKYIDNKHKIDNDILFPIIKGKIGSEIGSQFFSFLQLNNSTTAEDISNLVSNLSKSTDDIKFIADEIKKIDNKEPMQKIDMIDKLERTDPMIFLVYLYSLEMELLVSFLKKYKSESPDKYMSLVKLDEKLNNKDLFLKVIKTAYAE